jgi:hypothetical protein
MGAAFSGSNQTSNETNNISMNDTMACQATQVVTVSNGPVTIINSTFKGQTSVNETHAGQNAQCSFQVAMGAQAKNLADQTTQQKTSAGPAGAWAQSQSNNVVDLQNDIEMSIDATCGASQTTTVENQAIVINGDTFYGDVSLNGTDASQNFACTMDLSQQADAGNTSDQSTKQKTTAHIGLAGALVIISIALVILACVFGVPLAMMKAPAAVAKSIGSGPAAAAKRLAGAQAALRAACSEAQQRLSIPAIKGVFDSQRCVEVLAAASVK